MITAAQLAARQALIDSMAAVSIVSPEQMADMVLDGLDDRGYAIIKHAAKLRTAMRLVSQRLYGLSTVVHSNGAVKECAEYLDDKLGEDNSGAMQTFGSYRAALEQIADGDAHHDGAAKFMEIARAALEETK